MPPEDQIGTATATADPAPSQGGSGDGLPDLFEALTENATTHAATPQAGRGAPDAEGTGDGPPTSQTTADGEPASTTETAAQEPEGGADTPTDGADQPEADGKKPSRREVGQKIQGELGEQVKTLASQVETLTQQLQTAKQEGATEVANAIAAERRQRLEAFFGTEEQVKQAEADSKAGDYEGTQRFHNFKDNRELYGDLVQIAQAQVRENLANDLNSIEALGGVDMQKLGGAQSISEMAAIIHEGAQAALKDEVAAARQEGKDRIAELEAEIESLRTRVASSSPTPIYGGRSSNGAPIDMNAKPSDLLAAGFAENERERRGLAPTASTALRR